MHCAVFGHMWQGSVRTESFVASPWPLVRRRFSRHRDSLQYQAQHVRWRKAIGRFPGIRDEEDPVTGFLPKPKESLSRIEWHALRRLAN